MVQTIFTNPINKPAHKKNIVTYCSPLPNNVRPYIDLMNINQNFKNQLWALQNGINQRIILEHNLANRDFGIESEFGDLFISVLLVDTIPEKVDTLLSYTLQHGNLPERMIASPVFIEKGRFSDAQSNLAEINWLSNNSSQVSDFISLQQLQIQLTQIADSLRDSLIVLNEGWIDNIANDTSSFCQADAIALLEQYYDTIFPRMVYLGDLNNYGNTKMFFSKKQVSETCMLEVSPNPVNDILNLKIDRNADEAKYDICIYNSNGTIIKVIVFNTNETIKQLDVSHYPPGNYFVSLQNKNEVLCVKSIIVE